MKQLQNVIKVEYILLATVVYIAYLASGFAWYWPFVFFLVFDVSMIGYLFNTKIGAITYNIVHSAVIPTLLLALFFVLHYEALLFISLLWLFHITVDRACGYGLKHSDSFHHTHLGKLNSKR